MKRSGFFQFRNGSKVPLPFSDQEYENRLKELRKISEADIVVIIDELEKTHGISSELAIRSDIIRK